MGYNWAQRKMKKFKLSDLRELTTEEQLQLNGGANSESCSCSCSCSCNCGPGIHAAGYAGGDGAKNEVVKASNSKKS